MPIKENQNQLNDSNAGGRGRADAADKRSIRTSQTSTKAGAGRRSEVPPFRPAVAKPPQAPERPPASPNPKEDSKPLEKTGVRYLDETILAKDGRFTPFQDNFLSGVKNDWEMVQRNAKYDVYGDEYRPKDWSGMVEFLKELEGASREPAYVNKKVEKGDPKDLGETDTIRKELSKGARGFVNALINTTNGLTGSEIGLLKNYTEETALSNFVTMSGSVVAMGALGLGWALGGVPTLAAGAVFGLYNIIDPMMRVGLPAEHADAVNPLIHDVADVLEWKAVADLTGVADRNTWDEMSMVDKVKAAYIGHVLDLGMLYGGTKAAGAAWRGGKKAVISVRRRKNLDKIMNEIDEEAKASMGPKARESVENPKTAKAQEEATIILDVKSAERRNKINFDRLEESRKQLRGDEPPPLPSEKRPWSRERDQRQFNKMVGKIYETDSPDEIIALSQKYRNRLVDSHESDEGLRSAVARYRTKEVRAMKDKRQQARLTRGMDTDIGDMFRLEKDLTIKRFEMIMQGRTDAAQELSEAVMDTKASREILSTRAGKNLQQQGVLINMSEQMNPVTKMINADLTRMMNLPDGPAKNKLRKRILDNIDQYGRLADMAEKNVRRPSYALQIAVSAFRDNLLAGNALYHALYGTARNYAGEITRELIHYPVAGLRSIVEAIGRVPVYPIKRLISPSMWKEAVKDATEGSAKYRWAAGQLGEEANIAMKGLHAIANLNSAFMREADKAMEFIFKRTATQFAMRQTVRDLVEGGWTKRQVKQMMRKVAKGDLGAVPPEFVLRYNAAMKQVPHDMELFHSLNQYRLPRLFDKTFNTGLEAPLLARLAESVHEMAHAWRSHNNALIRTSGQVATVFSRNFMNEIDWLSRWTVLGLVDYKFKNAALRARKDYVRMLIGTTAGAYYGWNRYFRSPMHSGDSDSRIRMGKSGMVERLETPTGSYTQQELGGLGTAISLVHNISVGTRRLRAMGEDAALEDYIQNLLASPFAAVMSKAWFNFALSDFTDFLDNPEHWSAKKFASTFFPGKEFGKRVYGAVKGERPGGSAYGDLFNTLVPWKDRIRPHRDAFGRRSSDLLNPLSAVEAGGAYYNDLKDMLERFLLPRKSMEGATDPDSYYLTRLLVRTGAFSGSKNLYLMDADGKYFAWNRSAMSKDERDLVDGRLMRPMMRIPSDSESGVGKGIQLDYQEWNDSLSAMTLRWEEMEPTLKRWKAKLEVVDTGEDYLRTLMSLDRGGDPKKREAVRLKIERHKERMKAARHEKAAVLAVLESWFKHKGPGSPYAQPGVRTGTMLWRSRFKGYVPDSMLHDPKASLVNMMGSVARTRSVKDLADRPRLRDEVRFTMEAYKNKLLRGERNIPFKNEKQLNRFIFNLALKKVAIDMYNMVARGDGRSKGFHVQMMTFAPSAVEQHISGILFPKGRF